MDQFTFRQSTHLAHLCRWLRPPEHPSKPQDRTKQLLPPRRPVEAGAAEVAPLQASHKKVTVTNYQIKFTGPLQPVNDLLKNQNCCL